MVPTSLLSIPGSLSPQPLLSDPEVPVPRTENTGPLLASLTDKVLVPGSQILLRIDKSGPHHPPPPETQKLRPLQGSFHPFHWGSMSLASRTLLSPGSGLQAPDFFSFLSPSPGVRPGPHLSTDTGVRAPRPSFLRTQGSRPPTLLSRYPEAQTPSSLTRSLIPSP